MNILDNLPIVFVNWWLENVGSLEINRDYINLNTGMKSHLHLKFENGKWYAHMRYDTVAEINKFIDLHEAIRDCEHGRGFMRMDIMEVYKNGFGELDYEEFK